MRSGRQTTLTLTLITLSCLLAFGLRLHDLTAYSFWTDEGLTPLRSGYDVAQILRNEIVIQGVVTKDTHPPLYYLLLHGTQQLWGQSDFAYRYPSVLLGVLLLPFMFQLGRTLARAVGKQRTRTTYQEISFSHQEMWWGLTAVFLATINPLHLWYSREARMYTLLLLFTLAMTYALARAIEMRQQKWGQRELRYLLYYAVCAGLALYTHYTAIFLILAQSLFWLWLLWQQGLKKVIVAAALLGLLALIPLWPFTVGRLLSGAQEANFYLVSPYIMLQDVVHGFGLGITVDFGQPLIRWLDVGLLTLLLLGLYRLRIGWLRLFLASYLLATVLGLMAGSWLIRPMYQGVRHILIGSPAFLLLIAAGMLWAMRPRWPQPFTWLPGLAAAAVVITGPAIALNNLYNDPAYAKDDFRALAAYVDERAGPNDVVVYNNAVLEPLHNFYQQRPDLDTTSSPIYGTMARETAVSQLTTLAATYDRIWFVTDPPADLRDEEGLVRQWLDDHLTEVDHRAFHGRNVVVGTITYSTAPTRTAQLPATAVSLNTTWNQLPPLAGVMLDGPTPWQWPTLWFDLFWQTPPSPIPPALLRLALQDQNGQSWGTYDVQLPAKWADAPFTRQSLYFPLPTAVPPGDYTIWAQPFASSTGPALDEPAQLFPLAIEGLPVFAEGGKRPFSPQIQFNNHITLLQAAFADNSVRPGHTIPLTLFWQSDLKQTPAPLEYQLEFLAADGTSIRTQTSVPVADWLTTWPENQPLRENSGVYIRPDTPPGRYRLRWALLENGQPVRGRPFWRPWSTSSITLGHLVVEPWPLVTDLPKAQTVIEANFGDIAQLYGYDAQLSATELDLTLYWQAQTQPTASYLVFVHLLDANGNVVTQADRIPVDGLRPSKSWRPGEVLADSYKLAITSEATPPFQLFVGLYQPDDGQRLPITLQDVPQPNNQLELTVPRGN